MAVKKIFRFPDDQGNDWIGSLRVDEECSNSGTLLASMTIEKSNSHTTLHLSGGEIASEINSI